MPVVLSISSDPVAGDLVQALARPGGNATGNTQLIWELTGTRLELLRELAPGARRKLVVQSPDHPGEAEERRLTHLAADRLGLELVVHQVPDRAALVSALDAGEAAACDSLCCFTDFVTVAHRAIIAEHSLRRRIPAVFPRREFCEAGGLASYGPNIRVLHARLASFIERIASGTNAGDLPVEWPTAIDLIVNRRAARAIGLDVPKIASMRADELIE